METKRTSQLNRICGPQQREVWLSYVLVKNPDGSVMVVCFKLNNTKPACSQVSIKNTTKLDGVVSGDLLTARKLRKGALYFGDG